LLAQWILVNGNNFDRAQNGKRLIRYGVVDVSRNHEWCGDKAPGHKMRKGFIEAKACGKKKTYTPPARALNMNIDKLVKRIDLDCRPAAYLLCTARQGVGGRYYIANGVGRAGAGAILECLTRVVEIPGFGNRCHCVVAVEVIENAAESPCVYCVYCVYIEERMRCEGRHKP
jgi:hypothetical protein